MIGEWQLQDGELILWVNYDKDNQTSSGTSGCSIVVAEELVLGRNIEDVKQICLTKARRKYNVRNLEFKE